MTKYQQLTMLCDATSKHHCYLSTNCGVKLYFKVYADSKIRQNIYYRSIKHYSIVQSSSDSYLEKLNNKQPLSVLLECQLKKMFSFVARYFTEDSMQNSFFTSMKMKMQMKFLQRFTFFLIFLIEEGQTTVYTVESASQSMNPSTLF